VSGYAMFPVTLEEAKACVTREIAMRRKVYARQVDLGRMKPEAAVREIALMQGVLDQLDQASRRGAALAKIASGEGAYGRQALEYKNIAREALGLEAL
jgi:hypothetical protein